jgi:hypothetical protein
MLHVVGLMIAGGLEGLGARSCDQESQSSDRSGGGTPAPSATRRTRGHHGEDPADGGIPCECSAGSQRGRSKQNIER